MWYSRGAARHIDRCGTNTFKGSRRNRSHLIYRCGFLHYRHFRGVEPGVYGITVSFIHAVYATPGIEQVRLAYATALVLLIVIVLLNLTAFYIRYKHRNMTEEKKNSQLKILISGLATSMF